MYIIEINELISGVPIFGGPHSDLTNKEKSRHLLKSESRSDLTRKNIVRY